MKAIRGINKLSTRLYAAQAARQPESAATAERVKLQPQEVQVTKLPSGLVIASLENYSPASKIGVFVKAGCRYETADNQGVTHVLRLASSLTTKGASAFKICRGVEAVGATLSVTSSRENMVYSVDCLRDDIDTVMEYLINVTTAPEFRPWEVSDLTPHVRRDKALAAQEAQIGVMEALHEAAYKNALSNSLYCPDHMVGRIRSEHLHHFVQNNFTSARKALVGLGVDHSVLTRLGEHFLNVRSGPGASGARAHYRGGELRHHGSGNLVHAAVVSPGPGGAVGVLAFSVLQQLLGGGARVKRGSNTTSPLHRAVAKATAQPFDVSALHASYSDGGLFGVYTICQPACAAEVLKAALAQVKAVADGAITAADLTRAKAQLKASYLMSLETSEGFLEVLGSQALSEGAYQSPDSVAKSIDNVSLNDVANAAKTFVTGKKTMASSGNLMKMPFVDEL